MALTAEELNSEEPPPPSLARTAGSAGAIMVASLFLSRLLGLLRDTVIASHFGLLSANDSYRIAIQIPDLIFMLIAGGGLSSAFMPVFSEFWYTDRRKEAWKAFSVVVTVCSLIAVVLIAVAWFLAPVIVAQYGAKKPEIIAPAILMSRILLPAQYAFLIGSILLGTLYARKQFLGPGLAPNVYNLGIIFGAAVLPGIFGFGIIGVAWGALIGAFIGNIILPILMMVPQGVSFRPSFDIHAPGVGKFFKLLLPVILGFSLPSMVSIVTQYFASPYGPGSNTVLSYSNNLMQAPLGIFGQSFALGVFPLLSQLFAEKKMGHYRHLVTQTMRTVLYFTMPSTVLMFALAPLIVKIIYGYGKANAEPGQLELIALYLRIYCVAIPAWCLQPVLTRGFFSLHKTLKPVVLGSGMTLLFVVLCIIARYTGYGLLALPWAADIAAVALVVILFISLEHEIGHLERFALARTALQTFIAAVPAGALAYYGMRFVPTERKLGAAVVFLVLFGLSTLVYFALTQIFKMPEAFAVVERFKRKRKAK